MVASFDTHLFWTALSSGPYWRGALTALELTLVSLGTAVVIGFFVALAALSKRRRNRSLAWIWSESEAFNRFRGTGWMPDPCRTCDKRTLDFGGCRCQAYHLTGDAAATDPACSLSPHHRIVEGARDEAVQPALVSFRYRWPRA